MTTKSIIYLNNKPYYITKFESNRHPRLEINYLMDCIKQGDEVELNFNWTLKFENGYQNKEIIYPFNCAYIEYNEEENCIYFYCTKMREEL